MHLGDLLAYNDLALTVVSEGGRGWWTRPLVWCAPTEQLDPTPHLTPGALVLTQGMGLAFRDRRVWAAYVERLRRANVAALIIGLGPAHEEVPHALATECAEQRLPLLALGAGHPLLEVVQRVTTALAEERTRDLMAGWTLADACTRAGIEGGGLAVMLERMAEVTHARVSLSDGAGIELMAAGDENGRTGRTVLNLPSAAGGGRFRLEISGMSPHIVVQPLLGPAAAVIGMSLAETLDSNRPMHSSEAARFIGALYERRGTTRARLAELAGEAGFAADQRWCSVVLHPGREAGRARLRAVAWRARTRLGEQLGHARFMEHGDSATVVAHLPIDAPSLESVRDVVEVLVAPEPGMRAWVMAADDTDELSLALRMARRRGAPGPGETNARVQPLAPVDLAAVVDGLPSSGLVSLSRALLRPVGSPGDTAFDTLEAWLRCGGRTSQTCEVLFIHRNTLAYRLAGLRSALGMDLDDGDVRAVLSLALRVVRSATSDS